MKSTRNISCAIATILGMAAVACLGQDLRITSLDPSSGQLDYTLAPAEAVTDYACALEWRSTLDTGGWTNSWHQPFVGFAQSNGMFNAALPRFFRISCLAGQTTGPTGTTYTVTGVIPSQTANGMISWPNPGNTNLVYQVELASSANGPWSSQWVDRTNIHTTATVTNSFVVPMFFRVVSIKPTDGGEIPW